MRASCVVLVLTLAAVVVSKPGRRRWGDDDSDDDELTVDAVRKARAAKAGGGGDDQSLSQMQMQTKDVSKKALTSTQRSLKQLEQTTQMAGATLEKMHDQVRLRLAPSPNASLSADPVGTGSAPLLAQ